MDKVSQYTLEAPVELGLLRYQLGRKLKHFILYYFLWNKANLKTMTPSARSKFWGVSWSEDRGGGDNSIQFINIGRVGDKSFKEWRRKIGGGRVGDSSILTFLC